MSDYGKLVKVDKNGTKYYACNICPRCGGKGIIPSYSFVEGGICFECGGSGIAHKPIITKVYTEEYQAKLDERRAKREAKRIAEAKIGADERNKEFFEKQGFSSEGITYVVLGNTYSVKDTLKEMGAKFDNILKWHFDHKVSEFPTIAISVDDVYYKDFSDTYRWNCVKREDETYSSKIEEANLRLQGNQCHDYVRQVGKVYEDSVTFKGSYSFDTMFGAMTIYKFVDKDENVIVWKTSTGIVDKEGNSIEDGAKIVLKGKVKAHDVYKDLKQTVLTRCSVKFM